MLLLREKVMAVNVFFDLILMRMKMALISNDYVSKHKMIKNVFVENDREIINYQLSVDDKVVVEMIGVIYIKAKILKFVDIEMEYLDRLHHQMGLDKKYHVKMNDPYFDDNVDNRQEL
jgi:hypothetical protein